MLAKFIALFHSEGASRIPTGDNKPNFIEDLQQSAKLFSEQKNQKGYQKTLTLLHMLKKQAVDMLVN